MSNKATEYSLQYLKNLSADFSVSPPIPREGVMGQDTSGNYRNVKVNSSGEPVIDPTNLDARYVNVTGDTMTGDLNMQTNAIILKDSSGGQWALTVNTDGALVTTSTVTSGIGWMTIGTTFTIT